MRQWGLLLLLAVFVSMSAVLHWSWAEPVYAQDDSDTVGDDSDDGEDVAVPKPERQRNFQTRFYGFIDAYWEKVAATPAGVDGSGKTVLESNPHEFDVLNLNFMVQGTAFQQYKYFLNLAAPGAGSSTGDEGVSIRNAWVEAPLARNFLMIRVGKTYRRFGLYNEILDAVPTFIGIEPPELFDGDHLMLTRTTNLMMHGRFATGDNVISYALTTGNDEREGDEVPLGVDIRYRLGTILELGGSAYFTNGFAVPSRGVGEGSPAGGVVNWMERDNYQVLGGYVQVTTAGFTLQAEYWRSEHNGTRDPAAVLQLLGGGLNPRQLSRFGLDGAAPTEADVVVDADYLVETYYVRTGYEFVVGKGGITPYAQIDFYSNPETIAPKSLGGDNEAGLTDNGRFFKATAGVVFRPVPPVAFKLDASTHTQEFNGKSITYPEIRASLSYVWQFEL